MMLIRGRYRAPRRPDDDALLEKNDPAFDVCAFRLTVWRWRGVHHWPGTSDMALIEARTQSSAL